MPRHGASALYCFGLGVKCKVQDFLCFFHIVIKSRTCSFQKLENYREKAIKQRLTLRAPSLVHFDAFLSSRFCLSFADVNTAQLQSCYKEIILNLF